MSSLVRRIQRRILDKEGVKRITRYAEGYKSPSKRQAGRGAKRELIADGE